MNLIIDLTPSEKAQLAAAAKQTGLDPAELMKKLVREYLPIVPETDTDRVDSSRHARKEQDDTEPLRDTTTEALFAKWAEEDAHLTEEQRSENERIYTEIEKNGIPRTQI